MLVYSIFGLGSLCLLCSGFYAFSLVALALAWPGPAVSRAERFRRPSLSHLTVAGFAVALGAWGMRLYHDARREAQSGGMAARAVAEFFRLPEVEAPSVLSPRWTVRSTGRFEGAPVRIVEYADPLCPDCRLLHAQMKQLAREFPGTINLAFQFFPLEAACNTVVDKDKHPGACELSYMAAYAPDRCPALIADVFDDLRAARRPEWRRALAKKHGVEPGPGDPATRDLVHRIIQTGAEYEKTSEKYAHGIRSTPTMIVNGRMIIGTLPYPQLRAIVQAILDRREESRPGFMESWVEGR